MMMLFMLLAVMVRRGVMVHSHLDIALEPLDENIMVDSRKHSVDALANHKDSMRHSVDASANHRGIQKRCRSPAPQ